MLNRISRILPFLVVTVLCIGAVELFYGVAEHYLSRPEREKAVQTAAAGPSGKPAVKPEKHGDYGVIVQRNLFRSFAESKPEPAPAAENPLEGLETTSLNLALLGTVTGQAGASRAIILNRNKNDQDIYYQGDVIEGAEIKDIIRGKIVLHYQGKDEILDMSERAKDSSSAANGAPPEGGGLRRRVIPSQIEDAAPDMDAFENQFNPEALEEPQEYEEQMSEEPVEFVEQMNEEGFVAEEQMADQPVESAEPMVEQPPDQEPFFNEPVEGQEGGAFPQQGEPGADDPFAQEVPAPATQ